MPMRMCLTRYLPGRLSVLIHLAVMGLAAFGLPLAIGTGRPPADGEIFWLLGLFTTSIGLPFFALAANGPLLQAWFARTDHPDAGDPYFLYAASNVGSFLALLSYPTVVEPLISLSAQTRLWTIGFWVLIALIMASGALLWRVRAGAPRPAAAEPIAPAPAPAAPELARRPHLVRARSRAGRIADRGDRPYLDRCGGGAAPVGGAARALSFDLRDRVPAPAADPALARGRPAAALHPGAGRRPDPRSEPDPRALGRRRSRSGQGHHRHHRAALRGVLRQRAGLPWRAGAAAAGGPPSHRLLSLDGGRRHDRRHRDRSRRAPTCSTGSRNIRS